MERLQVTDALIGQLIREVAPLVEAATQWPLELDSLRWRVLRKDRGFEEVVLGRMRGAGIPVDDDVPRGIIGRIVEYVVEDNVLGAYQPSTRELLIVRENVDDSNLNGLRLVVSHELVHRGQHVHHGYLFDRVDKILRETVGGMASGRPSPRDLRAKIDRVTPIMTLIESHACYVQEILRREHFPDAVIESHFNIATLLLRVFGGRKVKQYTGDVSRIAEAAATGGVEPLYQALVGAF